MSATEQDLADALARTAAWLDETTTEVAESDTFIIDSLDKAVWAVRKIDQHRRRFNEAVQAAAAERARIDQWIEGERQRLATGTEHLESLLRSYHETELAEDPKRKTIRTPAGDLVARKGPDSLVVDDTVFVPWAAAHAPGLLNPPKAPTPAKAAIKKATGDVVDGQVVFADTGEFLPGVAWVTGETSFKVVTDEAVDR